jgi:signal transduction histidine kinase
MGRETLTVGQADLQSLARAFPTSAVPEQILSNLAEQTSSILSATRCSIVRVDPHHAGKAFVFTAVDDPSIAGYTLDLAKYPEIQVALDTNAPILVRDDPDDPVAQRIREAQPNRRTLPFPLSLALPLTFRDQRFGVLFLRFADAHHELSPESIGFCQLIAFGAAFALYNAREHEAVLAEVKQRELRAQQLEDEYRLRVEALSAAAHDIRVPLNSIIGYTDLLTEGAYGAAADEQKQIFDYIGENAHALIQIVNTIIDYARLEGGQVPVMVTRGEIPRLLDDLRITIEPLVRTKAIELEIEASGNLPMLDTDWVKLKRVLLNLVNNAVKFTDHGSVTLSATADEHEVRFEVADTGPGIAAEDLVAIFDRWRRVNPTRREEGGLGLWIVKQYCSMLGGTVSVESVLGRGSRFSVVVPLRRSAS